MRKNFFTRYNMEKISCLCYTQIKSNLPKIKRMFLSNYTVTFYALNNSVPYTQLDFPIVLQMGSYCVYHNTDLVCLFLLQKAFDICFGSFFLPFVFVFFRKNLVSFTFIFSKSFLFFDKSYFLLLYIEKKIIKRYFIRFFYML